jgi:signal recognition particle GTPase
MPPAERQKASKARDSKLSRARKISEAEKELDAVETRIDESESLLEQLAPLIADENIGTAEVQEIKDQLADAKQRRDVKKQELKELRETASLSVSSPETSEIAELSAKLSRKRDEIQRLEREIKGD